MVRVRVRAMVRLFIELEVGLGLGLGLGHCQMALRHDEIVGFEYYYYYYYRVQADATGIVRHANTPDSG